MLDVDNLRPKAWHIADVGTGGIVYCGKSIFTCLLKDRARSVEVKESLSA